MSSVAVTAKLASTLTTTWVPSALVTWASYGEPSLSVSTRMMVPSGIAA